MAITRKAVSVSKAETKQINQSDELSALAIEFYVTNRALNAAKKTSEEARTKLYALMKEQGKDTLEAVFDNDGTPSTLVASIGAKKSNSVDTQKLLKLVGQDVFMQVVSASQSDVESTCGTSVLNQCLITGYGKENVSVALKK